MIETRSKALDIAIAAHGCGDRTALQMGVMGFAEMVECWLIGKAYVRPVMPVERRQKEIEEETAS